MNPWPPAALSKLDHLTMPRFLAGQGASPGAIDLLLLDYQDLVNSCVWTLAYEALLEDMKTYYRIRGGNDQLPKAFATRLAAHIRYGHKVIAIRQNGAGVQAVAGRGGDRETFSADHLICTIPLTVLRDIPFYPPLPQAKQAAIRDACYTPVSRGYLQTRSKFWRRQNLDGFATTDLPIMRLWPGGGAAEGRGLLHSYVFNQHAETLQSMAPGERIRYTLEQTGKVYPEIAAEFEGGASKCWMEDPWARGAFIEFRPGQTARMFDVLPRAEGRIHFAGEHTSPWFSWMQGAIESGHRAAREI